MTWRLFLILVAVFSLGGKAGRAQVVPFLSAEEYTWLVNEISGDAAYEHIRFFTQLHRPRAGSPGLLEAAEYVERKAREYGLEDVRLIRQNSETVPWSNEYGELWLTTPEIRKVASTVWHPLYLSDYSRTARIESGPIVFAGDGTSDEDYESLGVSGAIVLAYGRPGLVMSEAVWKRGALGIITYPDPGVAGYPENSLDRPDQLQWSSIPVRDENGRPGTFGFRLTARQGMELTRLVQSGQPVQARVDIRSAVGTEKWQVMVEAFIRGTGRQDQDIVVTSHLQEEKFSANDDASGCASVLEIARSLQRLIQEGRVKRPFRNIRFWWLTEISSQRQYFADHPQAHLGMLANINQDMVGADQAQDLMRVQNMTRVPFSRFSFLNDVAEGIFAAVVDGNRGNLAVLQAGSPSPYPKPILASLGTRHRYNAAVIPFHNNTDHMPFNEAPIGVPGITFTNWPDNYIHSTDDDLWNIDRTQLQRNAFTVAAIAYVMAAAGPDNFARIALEVEGKGQVRVAEDYHLAATWVVLDRVNYWKAWHQVDQAVKRELRAVDSLLKIGQRSEDADLVESLRDQLLASGDKFQRQLETVYREAHGVPPESEVRTPTEESLEGLVPQLVAGPSQFLSRRRKVGGVDGLHPLMAFEVLSYVNSERSGLEIYRAVAAEARRAGEHYYGRVVDQDVLQYLDNLRNAGLIVQRPSGSN